MQTPPTLSVGHWPTALTKGGVKAYAAVVKGAELLIIELFIYLSLASTVHRVADVRLSFDALTKRRKQFR
jgi:hypothetical protein